MNIVVEVREVDRHLTGILESSKTLDPHLNTYTRSAYHFSIIIYFFLNLLNISKTRGPRQQRSPEKTAQINEHI